MSEHAIQCISMSRPNALNSARPDLFEDLAVTARRALVPEATSSGLRPPGRARQNRYLASHGQA
jgi:hypothetical protein